MTTQDWLMAKISEWNDEGEGYRTSERASGEVVVSRGGSRGPAVVYCVEPGRSPFTTSDIDALVASAPDLDFIVTTKARPIRNEVYGHADAAGVGIGTLGDLRFALHNAQPATAKNSERAFVENSLRAHGAVRQATRVAKRSYEIELRAAGSRPRRITIVRQYELTAEEVTSLIIEADGLDVDTIVSTNPAAMGFSKDALEVARMAGMRIMTWKQLLASLG